MKLLFTQLPSWRALASVLAFLCSSGLICLNQAKTPAAHEPKSAVIPARTFLITEFGGKGNGITDDTEPIQKAIAACAKAGGGRVMILSGVYLIRPIELASHVALVLEKGAILKASIKFADFGLPDPLPAKQSDINQYAKKLQPLISGKSLEDIAILGEGVIDGSGGPWWAQSDVTVRRNALVTTTTPDETPAEADMPHYVPRPHLVAFRDCARVHVQGVTLQNSPMFHLVPARCHDVIIEDVHILAPSDSPNTDGIDPANCRDVLIRRCVIDNGDDNIALKAGSGGMLPTENITVTDCTFLHGHGVSIGSEVETGVRHFRVQHCTFEGTDNGLRIKSDRTRGGTVEDVVYRDITMKNVQLPITVFLYYDDKKQAAHPEFKPMTKETPMIRNIEFHDIRIDGATNKAGEIVGLPESPVADVTLDHVRVTHAAAPWTFQDVRNLQCSGLDVMTTEPASLGHR